MAVEDGINQLKTKGLRFSITRGGKDILRDATSTGRVQDGGGSYGVGYGDHCMMYGVLPTDNLIVG